MVKGDGNGGGRVVRSVGLALRMTGHAAAVVHAAGKRAGCRLPKRLALTAPELHTRPRTAAHPVQVSVTADASHATEVTAAPLSLASGRLLRQRACV